MPRSWRLSSAKAIGLAADRWRSSRRWGGWGISPLNGLIAVEVVVHDGLALGGGERRVRRPMQAAGGDGEFEVGVAPLTSILIISPRRSPTSSMTGPTWACGTSTTRYSTGSCIDAVDLLDDDLGLADGELVAFASHGFDQDGQVQQAAAGDAGRSRDRRSARRGGRRWTGAPCRGVRGGGGW